MLTALFGARTKPALTWSLTVPRARGQGVRGGMQQLADDPERRPGVNAPRRRSTDPVATGPAAWIFAARPLPRPHARPLLTSCAITQQKKKLCACHDNKVPSQSQQKKKAQANKIEDSERPDLRRRGRGRGRLC
jgi:hypothetical protein